MFVVDVNNALLWLCEIRKLLIKMSQRKFSRGLNKPGMAAQLRETVSQVVRESTVLVKKIFVLFIYSLLL